MIRMTFEEFYEQLETLIKLTKKNEVTLIIGDLNAKVGNVRIFDVAGDFGLGIINERGDRLVRFCQEQELVLSMEILSRFNGKTCKKPN